MHRQAFLAGSWYPADELECRAAIERHAAATTQPLHVEWRAMIGPHAGWAYSGDAAAGAYRWLASARRDADLVVVVGSHRGPHGPNTIFRGDAWLTPLGELATAHEVVRALSRQLQCVDEPITPSNADNAVEVHLPFVRHFFPDAELLMLGIAASPVAIEMGRVLGETCKQLGRDTVFVGSTDLTHYGPNYGFAPQGHGDEAVRWVRDNNDRGFIDAILASDPARVVEHALQHHSACCPGAVAATMAAARAYGATQTPHLVDHYLSCDVQPGASFVGYAGIVL